jgi:hypothetical protein
MSYYPTFDTVATYYHPSTVAIRRLERMARQANRSPLISLAEAWARPEMTFAIIKARRWNRLPVPR